MSSKPTGGKKSAFLKNTIKTLGTASVDAAGDLMPNLRRSVEKNKAYVKNIYEKKKNNPKKTDIKNTYLYQATQRLVDNAIEDLKNGNFNNRERAKKLSDKAFNDSFNFDFDDIDFDSNNFDDDGLNWSDSGKEPQNVDATLNNTNIKIDASMDEESKFNIKQVANLNATILRINSMGFTTLNTQMKSLISFHNENTLDFYSNVDEKLAAMSNNLEMLGAYLTDISNNNEKMKNRSDYRSKQKSLRDALDNRGLAIEDWIAMYSNGDKSDNKGGLKFLFDTMVKPEIEKLVGNPVGFVTKNIIKAAIPKSIKNSMKDADNLIGLLPLLMQGKFEKWSNSSGIKSFLGNFLNLNKFKTKSNKYQYQKGPISWNGQAQRALTHVIPGYLSKILVGINKIAGVNQKELFYDYDSGKFTDKASASQYVRDKINEASKVSGMGTDKLKKDIMNELKKQGKIKTDEDAFKYDNKIDEALSNMSKKGKLFNNINDLGDITGYTYKTVKNKETGRNEIIRVPKDPKLAKIILDKYKSSSNRSKMNINEEIGEAFRSYQEQIEDFNENDLYQLMFDYKETKYKKAKKAMSMNDIFKKVDDIMNDEKIESKIPNTKAKGIFGKIKNLYNKQRAKKNDRSTYVNAYMNKIYDYFLDPDSEDGDIVSGGLGKEIYKDFEDLRDMIKSYNANKKKRKKNNKASEEKTNTPKNIFKTAYGKFKGVRSMSNQSESNLNQDINTLADVSLLNYITSVGNNASTNVKSTFRKILKNRQGKNRTDLSSKLISLSNNNSNDNDNNEAELVRDFTSEGANRKNTIELIRDGMTQISDKKIMLGTDDNPMVVRIKGGYLDKVRDVDDADVPGENTAAGQRATAAEKKKQNEMIKALSNKGGNLIAGGGKNLGLGELMYALESTDETLAEGIIKEGAGEIIERTLWGIGSTVAGTATVGKAAKGGLFSKLGRLFGKIGSGLKTKGSNIWSKIGNIFKWGSKTAGGADDIAKVSGYLDDGVNAGTKLLNVSEDASRLLGAGDDVARAFSGLSAGTKVIEGVDFTVDGVNVANKTGLFSKLLSGSGKFSSGLSKAGKVAGKLALPLQLIASGIDAFKGWKNAGSNYNKAFGENENREIGFKEKLNSATTSILSGLTFGLIKPEDIMQFTSGGNEKNSNIFKTLFSYANPLTAGKNIWNWLRSDKLSDKDYEGRSWWYKLVGKTKGLFSKKDKSKELSNENNTDKARPTQSNIYMTQGESDERYTAKYATDADLENSDVGRVYLRMKYDESLENAELLSSVLEPNTSKGHIVSTAYFFGEFARSPVFERVYGMNGLFNSIYEVLKANGTSLKDTIKKLLFSSGSGSGEASISGTGVAGGQYWDEVFNFVGEEESGNDPGKISNISWDSGGKSYGSYQFSLNKGSLKSFVDWMGTSDLPNAKNYHDRLTKYELGSAAFDAEWKKIASEDSAGFQKIQQQRMIEAFYNPAIEQIKKVQPTFDPSQYTVALNSLIMSAATQYGPYNSGLWKGIFGDSSNLNNEVKLIELFKTVRKQKFPATSQRYDREYEKAMKMYEQYKGTKFGDGTGSAGLTGGSNMSNNPKINKAIQVANQLINEGWPYVWGGESKEEGGFDCSGLCQYAYKQAGINIPRTTYEQIAQLPAVEVAGEDGLANARPGDLLFPHDGHVYMYEGNGMILEAPRTGLNLRRVKNTRKIQYIRRVITDQGANDCAPGDINCHSRYNKITGQSSRDTSSYGVTAEQFTRMRNNDRNNLMVQLRDIMNNVGNNTAKTNEILSKILDKLSDFEKQSESNPNITPFSLSDELLYTYKGY